MRVILTGRIRAEQHDIRNVAAINTQGGDYVLTVGGQYADTQVFPIDKYRITVTPN